MRKTDNDAAGPMGIVLGKLSGSSSSNLDVVCKELEDAHASIVGVVGFRELYICREATAVFPEAFKKVSNPGSDIFSKSASFLWNTMQAQAEDGVWLFKDNRGFSGIESMFLVRLISPDSDESITDCSSKWTGAMKAADKLPRNVPLLTITCPSPGYYGLISPMSAYNIDK